MSCFHRPVGQYFDPFVALYKSGAIVIIEGKDKRLKIVPTALYDDFGSLSLKPNQEGVFALNYVLFWGGRMKNFKWIKIMIGISLIGNLILAFILNYKKEIGEQTLEQIAFKGIQSNFVQLEGSIKYQKDNSWTNQSHVAEKLEDVLEGIDLAFEIGSRSGALNKEKENLLWELHDYLIDYKADSGFPNVTLTDKERDDFIRLGEDLRASGWGMNLGYGSDWKNFEQKTRKLIMKE